MRKAIGFKELHAAIGCGSTPGAFRQWLHRNVRDGHFPAPIKLGPNSVAWWEDEIEAHLAALPRSGATGAAS